MEDILSAIRLMQSNIKMITCEPDPVIEVTLAPRVFDRAFHQEVMPVAKFSAAAFPDMNPDKFEYHGVTIRKSRS